MNSWFHRAGIDDDALLLLHAALDAPESAGPAWIEVRRRRELTQFGAGRRLLPTVAANLRGSEALAADAGAMRALRVRCVVDAERARSVWQAAAAVAQGEGIPLLALKGTALGERGVYRAGERKMADTDILVPTNRCADMWAALARAGWVPERSDVHAAPAADVRDVSHSCGLVHPQHGALDLHWHVLLEHPNAEVDQAFWERARHPGVTAIRVPADEELLLHVVVHGLRSLPQHSPQWIADAVLLLRLAAPSLDWPRVVANAQAWRMSAMLAMALRFLRNEFHAAVPDDVIAVLASSGRSVAERLELSLKNRRSGAARFLSNTVVTVAMQSTRAGGNGVALRAMRRLPVYIRHVDAGGRRLRPLLRILTRRHGASG